MEKKKILERLQELTDKYWGVVADINCEDTTDEQAFWLEQELIGIGMEKEELEEELSNHE